MSQWLQVAKMADKNLLQLDSYMRHIAKQA